MGYQGTYPYNPIFFRGAKKEREEFKKGIASTFASLNIESNTEFHLNPREETLTFRVIVWSQISELVVPTRVTSLASEIKFFLEYLNF